MLEEAAGIEHRSVAYVASLGIGDYELVGMILLQVFYGALKSNPPLHTEAFIECEIGLVGYAIGCRGIDYRFVESK